MRALLRSKMKFSPDYKGMDEAAALRDFAARIKNYEEVRGMPSALRDHSPCAV